MRSFTALVHSEFRLYLREPAAVFFTLAFPLMLLFIFGSIFGNEPDQQFGGWGAMDVSVQGYLMLIIGTATLIGLPVTMSTYREHGILRRLRATPLRASTVILAQLTVNGLFSALGAMLLIFAALVIYDLRLPVGGIAALAAAWLLAYIAFAALGFLISSAFPSARTAQAVGSAIYFPQLFLSGAGGMPREIFPDRLETLTAPLPMTLAVDLLKGVWQGTGWDIVATAILLAITAIAGLASFRLFRWT